MIRKNRLTFFILLAVLRSQYIPNNLFIYNKNEILFDSGKNWINNTIFGSLSFQQLVEQPNDGFLHNNRTTVIGLNFNQKSAFEIFGFQNVMHNNFYFYLYPRIVSDPNGFQAYSGIPRDIKRSGFNSGETHLSGIGFQNENILFQIGRGSENWAAGNDIELVLSYDSPPYDYFKFQYIHQNAKFIYFHGFLENKNNYNRYITGRGIELTNKESMIIGFSEIAIYSGLNRPIDIGYMNPISTHLEIELNNRQNTLGTENGNAVWQISIDNLIGEKFRLSNNLIIDELVLDQIELDSGKVNGVGWSSRIAYNFSIDEKIFILFGSMSSIGTHTFRHGDGYNNFVQRNYPLGWEYGSDGYEYKIGCNYFNSDNLIIKTEIGNRFIGSNSVLKNHYDEYTNDYGSMPFPSGSIDKTFFVNTYFQWNYNPSTTLILDLNYNINSIHKNQLFVQIGMTINLLKKNE